VIWTDYLQYRARLRGFNLSTIEQIVRFSAERYWEIRSMIKPQLTYFGQEDILHLAIVESPEMSSIEISPNITAELNEKGELIGIEILNASAFVRDTLMESIQAKVLQLKPAG
jgi:uncharacterized protein YuzE